MSKRATKAATISYMIDDSSGDEFARDNDAMMLSNDSHIETAAPARKRGPAKSKSASVAAPARQPSTRTSRRISGGSVAATKAKASKAKPGPKRKALAQKQEPNASDTEEVDEFGADEEEEGMKQTVDEVQETQPPKPAKRGRPAKKKTEEPAAVEDGKKKKTTAKKSTKTTKREPSSEPAKYVPETQPEPQEPEPMDIEPSIEDIAEAEEPAPRVSRTAGKQTRAGPTSKQLQPQPSSRRRAGSASDTERAGNDPALRRKLGDMTKKFENLDMKYQNLREVGVRDVEANFAKFRKSADERAKAQDDIIASLKRELASQRALGSESKALRSEVASLENAHEQLSSENETLRSRLTDTQNEVKTLTTKLSATRAASASVQSSETKVPGSAMKAQRTVMVGSAEAAKEAQIRQLKEDLYSDLTGLIVRGVKRGDEEDVYDCIQTGRNGTLHFHLSVAVDAPGKPSQSSYEDAEFAYSPLLDENRDRDLLDILPDYLTEEICFPRSSAAKFYAKVVDCMTKKVVVED